MLTRNILSMYIGRAFVLAFCWLLLACGGDNGGAATPRAACVIIDNDYDIDDMMAIPLVIGNRYVASIIQSEGYTLPADGASALEQLVNNLPDQPNQRKIPIIVGGYQAGTKDLTPWPWLPFFRSMMNLSNGLLDTVPAPAQANPVYAQQVADSVANCANVSVLVIGTYTSFINYSPLIRGKIDKVIIMGQALGDDSAAPGRESFNCRYDLPACKTAMTQLIGLNKYFVDIPRIDYCYTGTPSADCYSPSHKMVAGTAGSGGIGGGGLPSRLKQALMNDINCASLYTKPDKFGLPCTSQSTWVPADVFTGPGGEMLLWDQTAALFLLHPEYFSLYYPPDNPAIGGKHYQPNLVAGSHALTIQRLRQLWTDDTNRAISFYP